MTTIVDSVTTNQTGVTDMTVTIDSVTTEDEQYGNMMGLVGELRRLAPDTAKARTMWARFDAIAGNRWFDRDTFIAMGEFGKRRNHDWDRPALALSIRTEDGKAWWTNSYLLVGQHGTSSKWTIPAVRSEANELDLAEWMSAAAVAAIVRRGGNPKVAATKDALMHLHGMVWDDGTNGDRDAGKAAQVLGDLAAAAEAVAPNVQTLIDGATNRKQRKVIPGRMVANVYGAEMVVLVDYQTGEDVTVVNAAYLASFTSGATLMAAAGDDGETKPIAVMVDGELVGLLMPIRRTLAAHPADVRTMFMAAVKDLLASKVWGLKATMDKATPDMWSALNNLTEQVRVP
jgi:hypothetical protein